MKPLNLEDVRAFVADNIGDFHQGRLASIERLRLSHLLQRKNPYLFRAKNVLLAQDFVEELLKAHLSSAEEEIFGRFLEHLAEYIAQETRAGFKSSRPGIDLEIDIDDVYTLIQIKSGPNWGNSSQHGKLAQDFQIALTDLRTLGRAKLRAVLGICYGRAKPVVWRGVADKVVGQSFWHLISGDSDLYTEIIEPLGFQARERTDSFEVQRAAISNRLVQELLGNFCTNGIIDWKKIVEFNSKNL